MAFDIRLEWELPSDDPFSRSRRVADALLAEVSGLTEFPLDAAAITKNIGVSSAEVWNHWFHVELHAPDTLAGALVHLSSESGYVELMSNPPAGCTATLLAVRPLLTALASHGLRVANPIGLLAEY